MKIISKLVLALHFALQIGMNRETFNFDKKLNSFYYFFQLKQIFRDGSFYTVS